MRKHFLMKSAKFYLAFCMAIFMLLIVLFPSVAAAGYRRGIQGLSNVMITDGNNGIVNAGAGDKNGIFTSVNGQTLTLSLTGSQSLGTALPITSGGNGNNATGNVQVDALGYTGCSLALTSLGTGTGSVTIKASNDGSTWNPVSAANQSSATATPSATVGNTTSIYNLGSGYRYYQFTLTAAQTSGTTTLFLCLKASSTFSPFVNLGAGGSAIGGLAATTTGGTLTYAPIAGLLSATLTSIKASSGNFYGGTFPNPSGNAAVWVNFYNATSITYGTTVPIYSVYLLPGTTVEIPKTVPVSFSSDIYYTVSTSNSTLTAPATAIFATVVYD